MPQRVTFVQETLGSKLKVNVFRHYRDKMHVHLLMLEKILLDCNLVKISFCGGLFASLYTETLEMELA